VSAERLIGLALRAYPREVRERSANEMLGTTLDISGGSRLLLARESLALLRGGLRVRARATAEVGVRRLLADACVQAATLWVLVSLASTLRLVIPLDVHPSFGEVGYVVLVALAIALALLGYDRLAGPVRFCVDGVSVGGRRARRLDTGRASAGARAQRA
jgi:hypothetical protein